MVYTVLCPIIEHHSALTNPELEFIVHIIINIGFQIDFIIK